MTTLYHLPPPSPTSVTPNSSAKLKTPPPPFSPSPSHLTSSSSSGYGIMNAQSSLSTTRPVPAPKQTFASALPRPVVILVLLYYIFFFRQLNIVSNAGYGALQDAPWEMYAMEKNLGRVIARAVLGVLVGRWGVEEEWKLGIRGEGDSGWWWICWMAVWAGVGIAGWGAILGGV